MRMQLLPEDFRTPGWFRRQHLFARTLTFFAKGIGTGRRVQTRILPSETGQAPCL
jgi:hypothetical protein